jgi:hypothetical protein
MVVMKALAYWAMVAVLIAFGTIAIFSIGAPFLLLGLMFAVLSPWRHRRGVIWAGVGVVFGFVLGYVLVAPLGCHGSTFLGVDGAIIRDTVRCTNLLGIRYEGTGNYNPSLLPALLAGISLAVVAFVTALVLPRKRPPSPPRPDLA